MTKNSSTNHAESTPLVQNDRNVVSGDKEGETLTTIKASMTTTTRRSATVRFVTMLLSVTAVVVLIFFVAAPNWSIVGGIFGASNSASVALVETRAFRGSEFDLSGNLAARGYYFGHGRLYAGEQVTIDGSTQLSPYINFNNGGKVYTMEMTSKLTFLEGGDVLVYRIKLNARGPIGFNTGCGHLRFIQENGCYDTYRVCSSTTKDHEVLINDPTPDRYHPETIVPVVVRIDWSNFAFHDSSSYTCKLS
jgi:hypothetical protein